MYNVKMAAAAGLALAAGTVCAASFPRLWVQNGYSMRNPDSWTLVSNLVERAAAAGYNGILSGVNLENAMNGWDKKALENYGKLRDLCALRGMDLIPSIWGMGYGGPACYWEPEAVEATAMKGLVYESDGEKLVFRPQPVSEAEFRACDFAKKTVVAHLKPFHHYRLTFKLKTENLLPDIYNKFRISCNYPETRECQLYDPPMKPTQDWTDVVFTFDTYESGAVAISAYKWRNTTGSFEVKDVAISEWGPCHMLSSDGMAPVVREMATGKVYKSGRDYAPVPKMKVFREKLDDPWQTIDLLPGSRIAKGAKVSVDCWIPAVEGQRQYSACPTSEDIYRYFEESARKIEDFFHPKTWLLAVDEWRIANRCLRCQNRKLSPAELIGGAVSRQHAIIRKVNPKAEIAAWADMFAPTDNAHDHYYCVKGDLTGSWNHVPKDILMVVWENGHGPVALKHFADNGFRTLAGAYYDRDNLDNDRKWLEACRSTPGCQGMMYTTWQRKYGLLEDFAEMASSVSYPVAVLGYQLDISRCKVPTMETLYRIVDILADLNYNQFQLYTEHTFAYKGHETVWREASPMTPDEVRALDGYCHARGIELVPSQNSFGHLEQWLRHPEYNDLADHPQGGHRVERWGGFVGKYPATLNPLDTRSLQLVAGLYDQLFPCFRSKYVNVGCDETVELEDAYFVGRSAAAVRENGSARVYLDFLKKIYAEVKSRGHTMMFWGDIILDHPELVPEIPEDVVCLDWGYRPDSPFDEHGKVLSESKRKFIVCPGTSAWCSLFGRVERMRLNVDNAVSAGSRYGALGYLLADWGDGGHPQPWIVSLPSLIYLSHRVKGESISNEQLAKEIDNICGCKCGEALIAYGSIYQKAGGRNGNSAELFHVLVDGARYRRNKNATDESIAEAFDEWRRAKSLLDLDGAPEWVKEDFALLDLLCRAVEVKVEHPDTPNFRAMFEPEYRRLWLRQNRLGGLKDSLALLFGMQGI